MTHTLHRQGSPENLADDFPVLTIRARGYNDTESWKMRKVLEMASRYPIVNYGDIKNGCSVTTDIDSILNSGDPNPSILHMVFTKKKDLTQFMKELKTADLGISVVVSGLFEEIFKCCEKAQITPHTANYSLGVFGRKDKLPTDEIMQITTMCGHSLVPGGLVKKLIEDLKKGKTSPEKAAKTLAKNCICGVFNSARAAKLLSLISGGKAIK